LQRLWCVQEGTVPSMSSASERRPISAGPRRSAQGEGNCKKVWSRYVLRFEVDTRRRRLFVFHSASLHKPSRELQRLAAIKATSQKDRPRGLESGRTLGVNTQHLLGAGDDVGMGEPQHMSPGPQPPRADAFYQPPRDKTPLVSCCITPLPHTLSEYTHAELQEILDSHAR